MFEVLKILKYCSTRLEKRRYICSFNDIQENGSSEFRNFLLYTPLALRNFGFALRQKNGYKLCVRKLKELKNNMLLRI